MKEWSNPKEGAGGDDSNDKDDGDDDGGDDDGDGGSGDDYDGGGEDTNYGAKSSKGQSQHSLKKLYHDASIDDGLEMPSRYRQHRSHHSMNLDGLNLRHDGCSNIDVKRGELFPIGKSKTRS